ncbi:MAG: PHP domain-containing protein [Bacteroidaceae bacterium]|nr:PHP domain-containing protein [Bacteroidaceae bacterium]
MKKSLIIIAAIAAISGANAQSIYYQDKGNVDMARHTLRKDVLRKEFVLPKVNGYTVYKSDLHSHTMFSDGHVTPEYRVREAWIDGLDILAVTEHAEYRPMERSMMDYLKGYLPEGTAPINNVVSDKPADNRGILTNLNLSNYKATKAAESYGITIIPGIEVTRTPETIGHYNALFIEDANTIYDADPATAIRNARAQGALIMHNHPGWRRTSLEMTEFEKTVYAEELIDGVEIMNGSEFYPNVVKRAKENKLFMAANTDIHSTTAMDYNNQGEQRNMTFILAKNTSLDTIKEALKKRRTIAYSYGTIAGDEELIKDFIMACIEFEVFNTDKNGRKSIRMINNTSMNFVLNFGGNPVQLRSFSSRNASVAKGKKLTFTVENAWVPTESQHPEFEIKF